MEYGRPREWLQSGEWPDGELKPEAPLVVRFYAVQIARNLRNALKGRTKSDTAEQASIARTTLDDILKGETWADSVTIANLEIALATHIWPRTLPPADVITGS
jgi:hypothetical protein